MSERQEQRDNKPSAKPKLPFYEKVFPFNSDSSIFSK